MSRAARRPGACLGAALVAWVAALGGAAAAQESDAVSILERASERYARTTSLCADFTQHLSVPLLGEERSGRGRLCQERPDRFAMRFTEPAGDAVVVDGTWVWIYYASQDTKQVLRFPVASSPGGFDLHREFLDRPGEKYVATREALEKLGGRDAWRIRLVPRQAASYQSAVVWIDAADFTLRQVRVEEENGSVRTVTLTRVELGAKAPAGWFTFTPPPGAQVIGG